MADLTTYGYCQCGCGGKTAIAKKTRPKCGHVKGEPLRFIHGHHFRGVRRRVGPDYVVHERTGCWEWQHSLDNHGYGRLWDGERMDRAHRVYFIRTHGAVPDGFELDHLCRNRKCVNPDHLEAVTRQENVRRGAATKLTPAAVRAIRESKEPHRVVAECHGVSYEQVRTIRLGRSWSDLQVTA